MPDTRKVSDSLGEIDIPADALYGAQTQRAIDNFPVSGRPLPAPFIRALLQVKRSAATVNHDLGLLDGDKAEAIVHVCDGLLSDPALMDHFPVDVFQTGSGTSSNMNANEVIAGLAEKVTGQALSPNDDVNLGQSSNDVIPTTIQVSAAVALQGGLLPALRELEGTIRDKAAEVDHVVKTGRTHLMDAMPVTLGQSLRAWADQVGANVRGLSTFQPELATLGIGGTAVGTGINTHAEFAPRFCAAIGEHLGMDFRPADNAFPYIGSQDVSVALSGHLKTIAVSLMKIANDLRWMNSGPLAGLGEIELEALQPGSSIMPGKVNPVIPESAAMVAARVIGNDATITVAGQSGNFELNVMLPVIADSLLESLGLLTNACRLLGDRAIRTFRVNPERIAASLARNPILVTTLNPIIGYARAAEIAKRAYAEGRPVFDVALEDSGLDEAQLRTLLDPEKLTRGGL